MNSLYPPIVRMLLINLFFIAPLLSFEIITQSPKTDRLGYGDWYMESDGELTLMRYLLKPGSVVLDVGAHLGEWSKCALSTQPTIKLMSFEPVPEVYEKLKNNLSAHQNVQIYNLAFSDETKKAHYFHYASTLEESGLSGFYYREVLRGDHEEPKIICVNQQTVAQFCQEQGLTTIDFLKIDTEGSEWSILKGAENLLKNHQIRAIQFEYGGCYIDAKTTLEQVTRLLTQHGYIIFRIIPTGLIHITQWQASLENYLLSNYCAICAEDMPGYSLMKFE